MIQDKKKIDTYLRAHKTAKNSELYKEFEADTDTEKAYIRNRKSRLDNKKTNLDDTKNSTGKKKKIRVVQHIKDGESLTQSTVERMIIKAINGDRSIPFPLIRMAQDHLVKLKIIDVDDMETLDMEGFLKLADDTKG